MVTGLNVFRDYFADDTDKYVLIGGAACDIVFTSNTTSGKPQFSDLLNLRILHTQR